MCGSFKIGDEIVGVGGDVAYSIVRVIDGKYHVKPIGCRLMSKTFLKERVDRDFILLSDIGEGNDGQLQEG
jgi:hypothetical protein